MATFYELARKNAVSKNMLKVRWAAQKRIKEENDGEVRKQSMLEEESDT